MGAAKILELPWAQRGARSSRAPSVGALRPLVGQADESYKAGVKGDRSAVAT